MRYFKGAVRVSSTRDIPLLLEVRNARFISHEQLFELMRLSARELSRESFCWRVRRLVKAGCMATASGNVGRGTIVYRIASEGLVQLESEGHFASVLNSRTPPPPNGSNIPHALELNNLRLTLLRANLLANWQSDIETASFNIVSAEPLQKDYDAVVDVWNGDRIARFALEYERTLKGASQYDKIRAALESENRMGAILYLAPGGDAAMRLARRLALPDERVAFATAQAFREKLLDTLVLVHPDRNEVIFRQLLRGLF